MKLLRPRHHKQALLFATKKDIEIQKKWLSNTFKKENV